VALTVGELNGIITIDDRAMNPALRRAENALRDAGNQMGDDAERAGQDAGEGLGTGLVRGVDGRLRDGRGRFVSVGRRAGDSVGDGLADGVGDGADDAVEEAESGLSRLQTISLAAGAAAGAVLIDAFGQAMEQGQITAKLAASMGQTPAEAQRYGKIAGELYSEAITEDFQGAADVIGSIMAAGLVPPDATNAQIKSIAANVSDLASTFELDLGQAANAIGQIMKTGLAPDAKSALDVMTRGLQVMGPRADDIADTFNEYSTIFRQLGISAEDATGILAQGMQAGARDTDVVADSLKELTLITQGGGEKVDDAFKKIGLSGKDMQKAFSSGGPEAKKALDQIFDGLRQVKDPAQRAQLAVALFGTKAEDMQKALFSIDPSKASGALGQVGGAADKMGDSLRDNAATEVEQFKRGAMQGLITFLGTSVIPSLRTFVGFLSTHQEELKLFAAVITAVVVPSLLLLGGKALWAGAQMARAWIMGLGPIAWVGLAIGALVVLVIAYWDEIKAATGVAWDWVAGKVDGAKDAVIASVMWLAQIPGWVGGWFGDMKDRAVAKALELAVWVGGLPGRLVAALAGLAGSLSASASTGWQAFKDASAKKAAAFLIWVAGLPGRISKGIGSMAGLLTSKGVEVVNGLWNGIKSMGSWIYNKLIGWAKDMIPGPIAKALGIASPSKVTKAQGRWIARGLVDGLTGSSKQVKSASQKLADIIRDSLAPGKRRSKALGKISAGTKQLLKLASQEEKVAARLKAVRKGLAEQIKARDKLAADVKKGVLDGANITQQDTGGWPQTAETILAGLKQDRAAAEAFAKNLAELRKKGVRASLISQIAQAGVEQGSSAAAALANATPEQIKAINKEQGLLVGAAEKAGNTAGDAMYGAGIKAAQGMVRGLQNQQKAIENQMLKIAKGMSKAIRKALGIKSPSRVMARVGAFTAQGLVKGMEGERRAVNRSLASLVETPAAGSLDSASARARAAASRKVVLELRSSGRGEDDYLIERMRRGIRNKGGGDVDLVLAGRRSG
jgi:phage-related minor tail protein